MSKYTPSVEASNKPKSKKKYTASVEARGDGPSYSDKILGVAQGVIEKGGGSKIPLQEYAEQSQGMTDTAIDGAYGAVQGATYNFADEMYGAGMSLYEEGNLDDYEGHRDAAREAWAAARERSPVATTVGEVGGAVLSPVNKVVGAGRGLRGIVQGGAEGAAQAYGATDKEDFKDQAIDTALGAGVGAGTGAIANAATKRFSKSPNATRAEVLGVSRKDYRVDGPGDRRKAVENVSKSGMLKNRKMQYDVDKLEFVPEGKSKFKIDELEANTEERLLGRAEDAIEKLQLRKEEQFGKLLDGRYVPVSAIDDMAEEIAKEYSVRGLIKGPAARDEAVLRIQENIYDQLMNIGSDGRRISLRQLDQLKRMAQEDVRNFSKGLGELGDNDELARITARRLRALVEDNIGGGSIKEGFKRLNSAQHDFLTVRGDLQSKIKGLELATPATSQVNKTSILEGTVDGLTGGSQGRLDSAARKEWYENAIPRPVRAVVPYALEETPGVIYRQNMEGQDAMRGNYRNPSSVPNIPEELIRTPLPRTTKELIEKKSFVLAKIAQMMPEMFDAVKDVFEHNPEEIGQLAQVISQKMPHVFSKDKYNRFDGRIITEADKQKAIKDTLLRQDISSIEQGKIITKLNKEGTFE